VRSLNCWLTALTAFALPVIAQRPWIRLGKKV
jgi:hypothetical protein